MKSYSDLSPREKFFHHYDNWPASHPHYEMDEVGVFAVYGEDANADLGGSHYEPLIAVVEGKFTDVIDYAVAHPRFWEWGAGGRIVKMNLVKV